MSLKRFVGLKDVRAKFRETFPRPSFERCQDMLAIPLTKNYSPVGTAFDYLLRFYLEGTHSLAQAKYWVANRALMELRGTRFYGLGEKIVDDAKHNHSLYLQDGQLTDELLRSCLLLAQLDPVFRRKGYIPIDLGKIDDLDIADLRNLIAIVTEQTFRPNQLCLLDPTFGMASALVGGADTDLVIDDTLIDIKTTKDPTLQRAYLNQLIGYYFLYLLGGIDGAPEKHRINNLGIYFSRYGRLFTFPVNVIASEQVISDFSRWFVARAEQEYGTKWEILRTL